ncbi:MAG TPA: hypothetical protein VGD38_16000, partial [Pyrinomonadaceae bacterium]
GYFSLHYLFGAKLSQDVVGANIVFLSERCFRFEQSRGLDPDTLREAQSQVAHPLARFFPIVFSERDECEIVKTVIRKGEIVRKRSLKEVLGFHRPCRNVVSIAAGERFPRVFDLDLAEGGCRQHSQHGEKNQDNRHHVKNLSEALALIQIENRFARARVREALVVFLVSERYVLRVAGPSGRIPRKQRNAF